MRKRQNPYAEYKNARNKVWDLITRYNINTLPVSLETLCWQMGITLLSYQNGKNIIHAYELEPFVSENDGFCTAIQNNYIIFFNPETENKAQKNFTIAHELGHIVLGHLLEENDACKNSTTVWNNNADEPNYLERSANIFASRLLAPACVLKEIGIRSAREIHLLCEMPLEFSVKRAKRMEELYARDKWYLNPLEQKAIEQFRDFIQNFAKEV